MARPARHPKPSSQGAGAVHPGWPEQELDVVARVVATDRHIEAGPGQRQLLQTLLHRRRQARRSAPAGVGNRCGCDLRLFERDRPLAVEHEGSLVVLLQLGEPGACFVGVGHDVGQRLTVLAPHVGQKSQPSPNGLQALGVVGDPLGRLPYVGGDVSYLLGQRPHAPPAPPTAPGRRRRPSPTLPRPGRRHPR